MSLLIISLCFLPAATAAESQHAAVCPAAARPPDRHAAAAHAVHHLTATAYPTGWGNALHAELRKETNPIVHWYGRIFQCMYLNFHVFHAVGLMQAQSLLNQLPQSQANLLTTQPSITLTTQVRNDARKLWNMWFCFIPAVWIKSNYEANFYRLARCHFFNTFSPLLTLP